MSPSASQRRVRGLVLATFALALVLAIRDLPSVLYDDAAITFRYAWRIAHGHGFTFNDGDRTNGASAPLYTLFLAAFSRLGIDLVVAAKIVGISYYALSCSMIAWLGARLGGLRTAAFAAALLIAITQYRNLALSGMESAFAVVLGLLVLCLLAARRDLLAGVVLGIAVVNKIDAGMLAIAVAIAYLAIERRAPLRLAGAALLTAAPWFVFSTWYFGSPVPHSAIQKATVVKNTARSHDPLWILRGLGTDWTLVLLALGTASLLLVPRMAKANHRLAIVFTATVLWGWGHLTLFSLVDLGDSYPWYLTVIYPTISLGAAVGCSYAWGTACSSRLPRPARAAAFLALGLVAAIQVPRTVDAALLLRDGHWISPNESFETGRRDAGTVLAAKVAPGEVVQTCFGWIEYQVPTSPIKEICPLSTRLPVPPPTWGVEVLSQTSDDADLPKHTTIVATITPEDAPDGEHFVIFRFDSAD